MAKYSNEEYEKVISQAAKRALDKLEETEPKDRSLQERIKIFDDYKAKLRKWKPREDFTKGYEFALNDYNADSLMNWLEGDKDYRAPDEYEGQSEASKILPLLLGVAKEGDDWYSLGTKKLEKEAKQLGYNTDIPGAYAEFLKLLGDYQVQYDRAKLLKEGQQGANYWMNKLLYPSSTQEAENAVLSGQGGDDATLAKLRALDAGTTTAMAMAPSLRLGWAGKVLGNQLVNSTIDAGLQGVAEGVRQLGTEKLSTTGQQADMDPVLIALGAGATRPAISTMAGGAATQFPGKIGQDIARGVRRGARVGGSAERSEIESAVKLYNKDLAKAVLESKNGSPALVADASGRKYAKAVQVPEMAEFFGIAPDANGKYSAKQLLNYYDANVNMPKAVDIADGKIKGYGPRNWSVTLTDDAFGGINSKLGFKPKMTLGKEDAEKYRSLFPDKAADVDANKVAFNTGEVLGQFATELGGRVEPVAKTNPVKVYNNTAVAKQYAESYKRQPWYQDLVKKNPEAAKIIEEAFKKKDEEE